MSDKQTTVAQIISNYTEDMDALAATAPKKQAKKYDIRGLLYGYLFGLITMGLIWGLATW